MKDVGGKDDVKRLVRVVSKMKDGRSMENVWNFEGVFQKHKKEISRVIVEVIGRDCFVEMLDEWDGSLVKDIFTATLHFHALGKNVFVGKTVELVSGEKITYYIDGNQITEPRGVK